MHFRRQRGSIAARALQLADFFRQAVTLSLQRLQFGDRFAPAGVQSGEVAQQGSGIGVARTQRVFHSGQVGPHKCEVEHPSMVSVWRGSGHPVRLFAGK